MDPATILGLSYVGKEGATVVAEFVKEVFGPSARALGEGIAAPLRQWAERRNQRAEKIVGDAAQMLDEVGAKAQAVAGEILVPLLQAGSVTEEPDLQRHWASLLANAASTHEQSEIIPGFIDILRQLTPVQATILDWMYAMKTEPVAGWFPHWPDVSRKDIESAFELPSARYALLITDMERLQLIEPRRDIKPDAVGTEVPMDQLLQMVVDRWNSRVKYESIGFTSLGIQFIRACTPPGRLS